jgi:hypothetical protein
MRERVARGRFRLISNSRRRLDEPQPRSGAAQIPWEGDCSTGATGSVFERTCPAEPTLWDERRSSPRVVLRYRQISARESVGGAACQPARPALGSRRTRR